MARTSGSPAAPRTSGPDIPPHLTPAEPARNTDLIAASLNLTGIVDLAYASLEQCAVTADAESLDLVGSTLLDVTITESRIASLKLRDASLRRVRIRGGRIGTLDLSTSRIDELELDGVRIDYLNLGGARAVDVDIRACDICTVDLPQSELTRVRFSDTRTDEVDPRGMRANDVDLRGLDAAAYLDTNSLRGTTMDSFQVQRLAAILATGIGIDVRD